MTENRVPHDPDQAPEAAAPPGPPGAPATLKWSPQPMVRWFSPVQLANTGAQALLSTIFGAYADKREMQAALAREAGSSIIHDYSSEGDLWIDFTADLGDGFDSTYSIAWLLGQRQLPAPPVDAPPAERERAAVLARTERARVLILGGDQVYPTASREEYAQRFVGPFEAALPWVDEARRPRMFAIPGNHDWYDGLTSFIRLFCQERWVGGWQTRQSRSYFAMKLPGRWWLLGIDIQLGADVDRPQLEYFERVAASIEPGDQVILCTAQPAWVESAEHPAAYNNLAFFERKVLCPRGAKVMVTLTGDLHHYARYTDDASGRHKFTAGGGGAYLFGTHRLPGTLDLPDAEESSDDRGATSRFQRSHVYPDARTSLRLRLGAPLLGIRNPGFIAFLGLVYAMYAWVLQAASRVHLESGHLARWLSERDLAEIGTVASEIARITVRSPTVAGFASLFVYALYKFCAPDRGRPAWFRWFGAIHGLAHLALILALTWLFAWFNRFVLGIELPEVAAVLFTVEMVVIGGFLGALIFGLALLPGVNFNEAYSAQRIEHFKNFLRLHITADGELTVYPIGVDRIARWERDPAARPGEPYFRPRGGRPPHARLIEDPIRVSRPGSSGVPAQASERMDR